jgi:murein L,D-transpeptidase YafK
MQILVVAGILQLFASPEISFEYNQKKFERVRQAYRNAETTVLKSLKANQISPRQFRMAVLIFKAENRLEVWAGNPEEKLQKVKDFEICAASGKPGPKRKEGDWQVPEGFYHIERFNPKSSYHLALGINYPNKSDLILGNPTKPGGQIMIHGACITIGCLPMTNEGIEEIYLYAVKARNNGQLKIPVYIFPAEPGGLDYNRLKEKFKSNTDLISFWKNLENGHNLFKKDGKPLTVGVLPNGNYVFR